MVKTELERRIQKLKVMIDNGSTDEDGLKGSKLSSDCCQPLIS